MSSKANNKGVAWLYNEVCALLDIWADQEIQQQLAGRLHNMCIYEKISKKLTGLGIHRTGEQCREKIKKLRRDYKTIVDNNYSPAFARKMLGCYDKVHEIFGKCTVVKPSFVIESIVYNESFSQNKKGNETDLTGFQTMKDSVSESAESKHIVSPQKVKSDFSDTMQIVIPCEQKAKTYTDNIHKDTISEQKVMNDSSDNTCIDTISEQKVKTDSSDNTCIDTINEQKVKTNFSDASNPSIKKDETNFRNAFEAMKKYTEKKSNLNTFKRKIERRVKKQKFLYCKILKRQTVLHNRFIELERKKFIDEIEQEHQRLSRFEIERQKHNEQEINLFKSLLQMMAGKQGVKLSLQCEKAG